MARPPRKISGDYLPISPVWCHQQGLPSQPRHTGGSVHGLLVSSMLHCVGLIPQYMYSMRIYCCFLITFLSCPSSKEPGVVYVIPLPTVSSQQPCEVRQIRLRLFDDPDVLFLLLGLLFQQHYVSDLGNGSSSREKTPAIAQFFSLGINAFLGSHILFLTLICVVQR